MASSRGQPARIVSRLRKLACGFLRRSRTFLKQLTVPADAPRRIVTIQNARAAPDASDGIALLCEVRGRRVNIPVAFIQADSKVRKPGDRGTLRIPQWVATNVGLLP